MTLNLLLLTILVILSVTNFYFMILNHQRYDRLEKKVNDLIEKGV